MAFQFETFQYVPVPVLSAIGREDAASTQSGSLVEIGTGIDIDLKGGIYVIGASATVAPVTGTVAKIQFAVGSDMVAQVTFPQNGSGRVGGLFMLSLAGTETRRFAWQAMSDGSGELVNVTDLHFVVMAVGAPAA